MRNITKALVLHAGDGGTEAAGHRVLIFAQLRGLLDIVERDVLAPANISFLRLDGGVEHSQRFGLVQRFNADPTIDVMLLTTHVGGLGLNLTAADTVIFLEHDYNPMKDLQVGRLRHRLSFFLYTVPRGMIGELLPGIEFSCPALC